MVLRLLRGLGIAALVIAYSLLAHYSNNPARDPALGAAVSLAPALLIAVLLAWRSTHRLIMLGLVALTGILMLAAWPQLKSHFWPDLLATEHRPLPDPFRHFRTHFAGRKAALMHAILRGTLRPGNATACALHPPGDDGLDTVLRRHDGDLDAAFLPRADRRLVHILQLPHAATGGTDVHRRIHHPPSLYYLTPDTCASSTLSVPFATTQKTPRRVDEISATNMTTRPLLSHPSPDSIVAWRADGAVTRSQFLAEVRQLAARFPGGAHLLNLCRDRYRFSVGLAAAIVSGKTCLLPSSHAPEVIRQIRTFAPDVFGLSDREDCTVELPLLHYPRMAPTASNDETVPQIDCRQLVAILFTSGSTGIPQPHAKYWGGLLNTVKTQAARPGLAGRRIDELRRQPYRRSTCTGWNRPF